MIVTLAAVLGRRGDDSRDARLQAYLVSSEFKVSLLALPYV